MTARGILVGVALTLSFVVEASAAPVPPKIAAKSAILVDAISGETLYQKNCHLRRPPASTTKIMTAIIALENGKLTDRVSASQEACKTRYCSLHLKPGEILTLKDMMKGLLVRSANDTAVCIAEHIGGSEPEFVKLMNEKAAEIGAKETHFVHPHGLYDPKHYSTAYDLAIMARYAIRIPEFNEFVKIRKAKIARSINQKDVILRNTAKFISKYPGADGIKTGYTREAGRCFVGSATRGNWRVISVVLGSPDAGKDTVALMDYAFKFYRGSVFTRENQPIQTIPVIDGKTPQVALLAKTGLSTVTRRSARHAMETRRETWKAVAPIRKGEQLGVLRCYMNGKEVGQVDLIAASSVERSLGATVRVWTSRAITTLAIALAGFLTYGTAVAQTARRRRRRLSKRG